MTEPTPSNRLRPSGSHIVTFTKEGYQSVSITITEARFTDGVAANLNAEMEYANATIRGTVTDGRNAGAPLAGVTVTLSNQQSATHRRRTVRSSSRTSPFRTIR